LRKDLNHSFRWWMLRVMERPTLIKSRSIMTVLSLLLVGVGLLHHYAVSGKIFDVEDVLHHEPLYLLIVGFAAGIWFIPVVAKLRHEKI